VLARTELPNRSGASVEARNAGRLAGGSDVAIDHARKDKRAELLAGEPARLGLSWGLTKPDPLQKATAGTARRQLPVCLILSGTAADRGSARTRGE